MTLMQITVVPVGTGSTGVGDYVADIPAEPPGAGPKHEHIQWEGETQPWLFIGFRSPAFDPTEIDRWIRDQRR